MFKLSILLLLITISYSEEPISPIPLNTGVDVKKAKVGQMLFFDPSLSRDNSISCFSCHDIYNGGADVNAVSIGFDNREGNIHSPTVLNARYNFKQFWNGRAEDLLEQADLSISSHVEHNMNNKSIEVAVNSSKEYRKAFMEVYGVSFISYELVLDAIVEFENALTTPNSRFDKFLRKEIELTSDERDGYSLFKQYGCITCHNGVNVGGNSFQKMGTFLEYRYDPIYPDKYSITKNEIDKNVFKVPTLRNILLTAPYFHDGSAKTLKEAIEAMSKHNLGIQLSASDIDKIVLFLSTLNGETPEILDGP